MKSGGALTWNWLVHFGEIGRYISDEIGQMPLFTRTTVPISPETEAPIVNVVGPLTTGTDPVTGAVNGIASPQEVVTNAKRENAQSWRIIFIFQSFQELKFLIDDLRFESLQPELTG